MIKLNVLKNILLQHQELQIPIIVHTRSAEKETLDTYKEKED